MERLVNLPDDVLESVVSLQEKQIAEDVSESSVATKSDVDRITKWIDKKNQFIALEREEDAQQTQQALAVLPMKELMAKGLALKGLMVDETRTGLWGRQIMTLSRPGSGELPTHRFGPGDIVCVMTSSPSTTSSSSPSHSTIRGLVYKVSNEKIAIALSDKPNAVSLEPSTSKQQQSTENDLLNIDYTGKIVSIVLMGNDTTFKRMEIALKKLASLHASKSIPSALNILLGCESPDIVKIQDHLPLESRFTGATMNDSQLEAIAGAMASKQVFMIHGPPGTGKTTVLVEYILQAVKKQGKRLLVCAPSNVAVDNIVERLAPFTRFSSRTTNDSSSVSGTVLGSDFKMVRIGHPARVQSSALAFTIEEQYRQSNGYEVVQSLLEDMDKVAKAAQKTSNFGERRQLKKEWIDMKRDLKKVTATAMKQVVSNANVVLATCTGADDKLLRFADFDIVVVDEAAQALDPIILIPLLKAKKIILAGDHLQLPPTIKSTKAIEQSLCTTTFFERCVRRFPNISKLLSVQYRMNDLIMKYSSTALYRGKLTSDQTVKEHLLSDLVDSRLKLASKVVRTDSPSSSHVAPEGEKPTTTESQLSSTLEDYLKNPLILVDTAGCSFDESGGANESKWNEGEAKVVVALVNKLIEVGLAPKDVGIISPYNAQVDLLRNKLRPKYAEVEIASVDSFQGREKECIIYTLVRSNAHRNVGFLSSDQRTNVAITRAKRLLIIVGDTETLGAHKFLKRLFSFCESNGQYWSAAEFEQTYEAVDDKAYTGKGKGKAKSKPNQKGSAAASPSAPAKNTVSNVAPAAAVDMSTNKEENLEEKEDRMASANVFDALEPTESRDAPGNDPESSSTDAKLESSDNLEVGHETSEMESKLASTETTDASSELESVKITDEEKEQPNNTQDLDTKEAVTSEASQTAPPPSGSILPPASAAPKENARIITKPPADYREMQRAKFEAQKKASLIASSSSPSSSSADPDDSRFGLPSTYFPQPSMHAPKPAGGAKKTASRASPSSSAPKKSTQAPEPIKKAHLKIDNDDAFLDSLIKEQEKCYAPRCKESTKLFGEMCKYCRHLYCITHWGPESHGCGEEAKREGIAAAKKKSADLRIKASAKPVIDGTPRMKDWQKSVVQDKLAKKVQAQKQDRAKKPPSSAKK